MPSELKAEQLHAESPLPPTPATSPPTAPKPAEEDRLGTVFWVSVGIASVFVAWGVFLTDNLNTVTSKALNWITASFGWSYLVISLAILVFLVFLAFSPYGSIRLGKDTDRPEFSTITWLAMILSAVMGIGLVSYGIAEPISHFATPPHGLAQPETRARFAVLLLRLGSARVGHLRRLWPRHRVFHPPQGPAHPRQPDAHPAHRGTQRQWRPRQVD